MENREKKYDEDYKCGNCKEWSVSASLEYHRLMTKYDEELFEVLTCSICQSECASPIKEREYKPGDTVFF